MFIFPAGQSYICIIPFWNYSMNINILSQSQNFPIRTQIAFYEKLAIIPVQQIHFHICIFILTIFRTVVISPRHRMVSKSYLFFRRRKPSFQHSLNPQHRSRSDWRNLCLRERSERHKLWQRCCRGWSGC